MIHGDKIFKSTKNPSQWAKAVFVIGWLENRHETNAQQLAVREGVSLTRLPWTLFFQTVLHLLLSFSVEKDICCSRIKTLTSKLCTFCLKIKEEDWLQWLWLFDSHLTSTVHLWRHLKKWKKPSIPDITRSSLEHCQITLRWHGLSCGVYASTARIAAPSLQWSSTDLWDQCQGALKLLWWHMLTQHLAKTIWVDFLFIFHLYTCKTDVSCRRYEHMCLCE